MTPIEQLERLAANHPDMTLQQAAEECLLTDFPAILAHILSLEERLAKAEEIVAAALELANAVPNNASMTCHQWALTVRKRAALAAKNEGDK